MKKQEDRVCLAVIGAAHGVRGEVRVKPFGADPLALGAYGPLADESGTREFEVAALRPVKGGMLVVRFRGVADRDAAERLNGTRLYVDRDRLPPPGEDEFYHADLIGLGAVHIDGAPLGRVVAVPDFGAGDLLEIATGGGKTLLVPFTRAVVPEIDLAGGRLVVDPPPGLLDEAGADEDEEAG
ncbi:MAG TPA: ribosome maturation factor RimM, partial [Hyphomicrobiales bacterium]|nr:ribosome maturation factor RimM [Hyphomicrobiales bacterium]